MGDRMVMWAMVCGMVVWAWSGVQAQGYWETVVNNAGISTMHAAVTHYGNVVLLDRTNIGASQLALGGGACRDNPADRVCDVNSSFFTFISSFSKLCHENW